MAEKELADKQGDVSCVLHGDAAQPCSCFGAYFSCIQPAEGMHHGCARHDAFVSAVQASGSSKVQGTQFPPVR